MRIVTRFFGSPTLEIYPATFPASITISLTTIGPRCFEQISHYLSIIVRTGKCTSWHFSFQSNYLTFTVARQHCTINRGE